MKIDETITVLGIMEDPRPKPDARRIIDYLEITTNYKQNRKLFIWSDGTVSAKIEPVVVICEERIEHREDVYGASLHAGPPNLKLTFHDDVLVAAEVIG